MSEIPKEDEESPQDFFMAVDMGRAWFKDSSLEKWFPFTARELTTLRARVRELEEKLAVSDLAVELCDPIVDELNLSIRQFQARIRELDGIDRKWNDINSMNVEIHERLEAKLATAVEALEEIRDNQYLSEVVSETLREALAKIRS